MIGPETLVAQELGEAERIALAYAPVRLRRAYQGLLLLDAQLGRIALTAREPALAQLKLAWWRDACANPAANRGQPVLEVLAQAWAGRGWALAVLIDAWEELAVQEDFLSAADRVAGARVTVFTVAVGTAEDTATLAAARRWTLTALADHAPSADERAAMLVAAREIGPVVLPRVLRPLAVLDGLAKRALSRGSGTLLGDRLSPLAAIRLGIFGR